MTVLLAVGLVAAWSVLIPGFMDWDDMVVAVIGSLRLTGPVAALLAAWVAVRRRRADRGRPLTPWRAAKAPLGILGIVTGSFAAAVLVLGLRAALAEQSGRLPTGGLTMCVAGLALYVMVGWIAGWLLPFTVTPVLAGIGTYGLFTWVATGWTWADRLTPAAREPYDPFTGLGEAAFSDQTLWLVGLSTALLLGWVALVTRQILALAAAVIAVLAAGTGAARLVTEPQTMAASERYSCLNWPISVCVRPALRDGLAELAGVFTTLASRLVETPAAFKRVEQSESGTSGLIGRGVIAVRIDGLGPGYAQRAVSDFLDRLARPCPGTIAAGYRAIVIAWLRNVPLPAGPLPEHQYAAAWFSGLTEDQRRDWLRMFYSDFVTCRLQSRHFGGGARPADPNLTGYPVNPTPGYAPAYPLGPSPNPTSAYGTGSAPAGTGPSRGEAPETVRSPRPALSPKPQAPAGSPAPASSPGSRPERDPGRGRHGSRDPGRHPGRPGGADTARPRDRHEVDDAARGTGRPPASGAPRHPDDRPALEAGRRTGGIRDRAPAPSAADPSRDASSSRDAARQDASVPVPDLLNGLGSSDPQR